MLVYHIPAPPNYPLKDPKYHLLETIRPLMEVYLGGLGSGCNDHKSRPRSRANGFDLDMQATGCHCGATPSMGVARHQGCGLGIVARRSPRILVSSRLFWKTQLLLEPATSRAPRPAASRPTVEAQKLDGLPPPLGTKADRQSMSLMLERLWYREGSFAS